jgi:hypothetical protein
VRCQVRNHLGPTRQTNCPLRGNAKLEISLVRQLTLTLPLSLVQPYLSLHSLTHSSKEEEGEGEGEGKEGRIGVAAARGGHGDHLGALIHKRLGFVEGGALSPSPQGARRRRSQEQEDFELPRGRSSFSNFLESITSLLCSLWYG